MGHRSDKGRTLCAPPDESLGRAKNRRLTTRLGEPTVEDLQKRLLAQSFPRLQMSLIVILAGIGAFLCSAGLLASGVSSMAARYFVATAIGYMVFLLLIRVWLAYQRRRWSIDLDVPLDAVPDGDLGTPSFSGGGGSFGGGGAGRSFDSAGAPVMPRRISIADARSSSSMDAGSSIDLVPDLDEAWPFALGVILLLAGVVALAFVIYASPVLFAEVLLDAAVVGAVYRRARRRSRAHWLQGVVRRIWLPATALCVFVALAGLALQASEPGVRSLGDVIETRSAP